MPQAPDRPIPAFSPVLNWKIRALDVRAFAQQTGQCEGDLSLHELPRLAAAVSPAEPTPVVHWRLDGFERQVPSADNSRRHNQQAVPWLRLQLGASLQLACQRCFAAMPWVVDLQREYRFTSSEVEAAAQDLDSEEDVLALQGPLDLLTLIEDELLMALPMVPVHELQTCESQVLRAVQKAGQMTDDGDDTAAASHKVFEVLGRLKKIEEGL